MQFEMQHQVGTDYSTVSFQNVKINWNVIQSMMILFERLGGKMIDTNLYQFPVFITSEVLSEVIHNTCFVCGGLMKDGQAIQEGKVYVSSYDSAMETYQGQIEYPNPNDSKVIKVRKCSSCGHSHT